jgi:hypothetical protein
MILETCQLLCTAIWVSCEDNGVDADPIPPCKSTHKNHPSAIWARKNKSNWKWLRKLGLELCKEYTYRYDKNHKLEEAIKELQVPDLPEGDFSQPPQCMGDIYKVENNSVGDSILAYRNYYTLGKCHLHFWKDRHAWKRRNIPKFVRKFYEGIN